MPSDHIWSLTSFLLVELSSVVLELVVIGPLREVACVPYMVLRWFYGEYCNL